MKTLLIFFSFIFAWSFAFAQEKDSLIIKNDTVILKDSAGKQVIKVDTNAKRKFIPRQATIRSAIFPGLGQIYNRKYWKLPLVYAAVGIPTYAFLYNMNWYKKTRDAAKMIASGK